MSEDRHWARPGENPVLRIHTPLSSTQAYCCQKWEVGNLGKSHHLPKPQLPCLENGYMTPTSRVFFF